MDDSTYYRDHWVRVEPERVAAYEEMFRWRPQMEPLIAPAALEPGLVVVDYGCGPGGLAIELARRVGAGGHSGLRFSHGRQLTGRAATRPSGIPLGRP